jgi:hypothetical protein
MKISRKPTPPRPTAPSRPSRLVLASLRDGEIVDVENISKYVTPELAYVVRVERAKKPRLADRTASPPISLRVLIMRPEEGVGRSCIGRRPNHNGPTSRRNGPLGAREPGPSEAQRTARSERGPRSSGRTRPGPDRRRRARRGSATSSGTGMPGSPTANGATGPRVNRSGAPRSSGYTHGPHLRVPPHCHARQRSLTRKESSHP